MRLVRSVTIFLRAPLRKKLLCLEAVLELSRARLRTLQTAKSYTRDLGDLHGTAEPEDTETSPVAAEIGRIVHRTATLMPFRAVCLQQAIAVRRMLSRRDIPATVFLGLERSIADEAPENARRAAHAWVSSGGDIVNGDGELNRYVVVGIFH